MSEFQPRTERTRLAVAGARATTQSIFGARSSADKAKNHLFMAVLLLGIAFAIIAIVTIVAYMTYRAWPRLGFQLFTNHPSRLNPDGAGFRPAILGSLYLMVGVVVITVPLGVGAAVYLEQFADRNRRFYRIIELNIQNLAGVPAIVFGILGLAFIVRGPLSLGFTIMSGSLTLAMLVLPTVILASREAIRAVPPSIRDGSLALGATEWQAVSRQVLPSAIPGILTGVILSIARAIGEAAPLLLVGAFNFVQWDPNLSDRYTALPVQIFNYAQRPQEDFRILAAAGVIVVLVVVLSINSFAIFLRNRFEREW